MRGQDEAFTEFVLGQAPALRRLAYGLVGDWHSADDVLQTALLKLYFAWPRIRADGNPEAYARRIIMRCDVDRRRRPWRRERPTDLLPDRAATETRGPEEQSALFDALRALPVQQRKVVVLRHWLGLSVRETAHELGISEGTVKSHSSRGLAALESVLAPQWLG